MGLMSIRESDTGPVVEKQFSLLRPVTAPPREELVTVLQEVTNPEEELAFLVSERPNSDEVMSLDIETEGNDVSDPNSRIVGIGFSDSRGSLYVDLRASHPGTLEYLVRELSQAQVPLIAHNLFFDASYLIRDFPEFKLNWRACTYALYKLLATEGFPGQSWSLKAAQQDMLGWLETNELELDTWLINKDYYTSTEINFKQHYYWHPPSERWRKPDKGKMYLAPASILGKYCAADADSTYLLYVHVLEPVLIRFSKVREYYERTWPHLILLLIKQKLRGIKVDVERLTTYAERLDSLIAESRENFLSHPDVVPHVKFHNERVIQEVLSKEPEKYLKKKLGKEPPRFKKDGTPSANWTKWAAKRDAPPVLSKNWEKWAAKYEEACATNHFNLNSGDQKRWLFYERLNFPVFLTTESGLPATDGRALKGFGEPGSLLSAYNDKAKEQSYVGSCLSILRGTYLHPSFRCPGTLTGRLAGAGGFNFQQQPKTVGYLSCFEARPGTSWIDWDFASLEQVVLAELSRDASLWKLYGPEAKQNDVYLFNAANLPGLKERILAEGYDPENPTPEAIDHVKKVCKKERGISKIITLGSSYGMGPNKLQMTLRLNGIDVSLEEARRLHGNYWDLYAGVKKYEAELLRQYRSNGGWLFNGIGCPIGICSDYTKDIVNRVVQRTGHDLLILWVELYSKLLDEAGVEWNPIIVDFHDESIIEVPTEQAEIANRIMGEESFRLLNEMVKGEIPLRGDGGIIPNLAYAKCEAKEIEEWEIHEE